MNDYENELERINNYISDLEIKSNMIIEEVNSLYPKRQALQEIINLQNTLNSLVNELESEV